MPRSHCPPSRRGHTWQTPAPSSPAHTPAERLEQLRARRCIRCDARGRVTDQGTIQIIAQEGTSR